MSWNTANIIEESDFKALIKKVGEYNIYSYYLNEAIPIGRPISSPFREDKHPSFCFFIGKKDKKLMWQDFAKGQSGDIIAFIRLKLGLSNGNAIKRIIKDINDGHIKITEKGEQFVESFKRTKTIINVKRKNFTERDDNYWSQFGITRDILKLYNVFPIANFWINDEYQPWFYSQTQPMYAYKVFDKFKIYRPLSNNTISKWRTNFGKFDIQGWEQLPEENDTVIITKSLKDVMTLYSLGYNAIAGNSENVLIPDKVIKSLQKRFKRIIIFYDNDEGGIAGVKKMTEKYNNIISIFLPKSYQLYDAKDISDFYKEFGREKATKIMEKLIK